MPRRSRPKKSGQQSKLYRTLRVHHRRPRATEHPFSPIDNDNPFGDSPICRTCRRAEWEHMHL